MQAVIVTVSFLTLAHVLGPKTGFHPGSSPGQAFSGTSFFALAHVLGRKTGFHFSGTSFFALAHVLGRKTGFHFSGTCACDGNIAEI
jgi:hypothetical protein